MGRQLDETRSKLERGRVTEIERRGVVEPADLLAHGLIRGSFVPPTRIQALRGKLATWCSDWIALRIAETLEEKGIPRSSLHLRWGMFGAEPWTPAMRVAIEAKVEMDAIDIYGLSEIIGPGVAQECIETKDGLTVWEDHFYPEIINPDTGEVVPERQWSPRANGSDVARWNGTNWSALGTGVYGGFVFALAAQPNGDLVAAGSFTSVGGVSANRIARWDGAAWTALGSGANDAVRALCVFDDGGGPALHAGRGPGARRRPGTRPASPPRCRP